MSHALPRRRRVLFTATLGAILAVLLIAYAVIVAGTARAAEVPLSQGKPATASSSEYPGAFPASAAVDGNTGTRWSSAFSDPQWLQIDLGSSQQVCQVVLNWEAAYATSFQIQVSDGGGWTTIYSTTTGTGGVQTLNVSGTGRY